MRTIPVLGLAAVLAGGAAIAGPAFAPPPKPGPPVRKPASTTWTPESLSQYADAMMADKAGDLEAAERAYDRAADDAKQPALYYNLADVQRRMERYKDAIKTYGKYLEAAPDAPDRADVEKLIEKLKATPPVVTIDGDDPRAVVFVDGVLVGPSPQTLQMTEGMHSFDRIGPESFRHETDKLSALEHEHVQTSTYNPGKDDTGNVVLSAAAAIRRSGGWRDQTREWRAPARMTLEPGHYETQMFDDNYLCSPVAFDVPKGDGVTYVFIDAAPRDPKDRGCIPITVRVKKVSFPP